MATKLGQNVISFFFLSPLELWLLDFLCVFGVSCMESFDPVCPLQTATAFNNNNSSHLNKYILIQQTGAVFQTRGQI